MLSKSPASGFTSSRFPKIVMKFDTFFVETFLFIKRWNAYLKIFLRLFSCQLFKVLRSLFFVYRFLLIFKQNELSMFWFSLTFLLSFNIFLFPLCHQTRSWVQKKCLEGDVISRRFNFMSLPLLKCNTKVCIRLRRA